MNLVESTSRAPDLNIFLREKLRKRRSTIAPGLEVSVDELAVVAGTFDEKHADALSSKIPALGRPQRESGKQFIKRNKEFVATDLNSNFHLSPSSRPRKMFDRYN